MLAFKTEDLFPMNEFIAVNLIQGRDLFRSGDATPGHDS